MLHFSSTWNSSFWLKMSTSAEVIIGFVSLALWMTIPVGMIQAADQDTPKSNDTSLSTPKSAKLPLKPEFVDHGVMSPDRAAFSKATVYIMNGLTDELEAMLIKDPNLATLTIDQIKSTLLHKAGMYDQADSVRLILKYKADATAMTGGYDPVTPLHVAAQRDSVHAVEALLEAGVDINILAGGPRVGGVQPILPVPVPRCSPLGLAAAAGSERVVEILLDRGAKLNVNPPETSYSALHRAMEGWYNFIGYGNLKRIEIPALKAARGNRMVIELLIEHGARLDDLDYYGNTPFHIAVNRGALETAEYLLEKHRDQIDVNSYGQFESPPLQLVIEGVRPLNDDKAIAMIKLLLKAGADKSRLCGPYRTPATAYTNAKENHWSEATLELLRP